MHNFFKKRISFAGSLFFVSKNERRCGLCAGNKRSKEEPVNERLCFLWREDRQVKDGPHQENAVCQWEHAGVVPGDGKDRKQLRDDEVASKIINRKLEPKMRVNIGAVVGKYGEAGEQKYCFKILLIDYADPKSTEKTELAQVLTLASKQVKLTDGDIFSQLLPEDFKLL